MADFAASIELFHVGKFGIFGKGPHPFDGPSCTRLLSTRPQSRPTLRGSLVISLGIRTQRQKFGSYRPH
jgi:hypothetical protein